MNRIQIEMTLERALSKSEWRCTEIVCERFGALAPGHTVPKLRIECILVTAANDGWVDRKRAVKCTCRAYPNGCGVEWRLAPWIDVRN